jgi:hypothetical protein
MTKVLMKIGIEGVYLNVIMAVYDKFINIMLNEEKLKSFSVKSGRRQRCPLSPVLLTCGLEFLATAIGEEEKNKRNINWKGSGQSIPTCR